MPTTQAQTSYSSIPNNTAPQWWKDPGLRKNMLCVVVLYFNAFTWGYDGTLLNALQALPRWLDYFDNPTSDRLGLIAAIFYFPALVTPFFASFMCDHFGRRLTLLLASLISVAGALVNTFANNQAGLLAGRAIMGAALGMQSTVGPPLMQEICHPRLRAGASALWFFAYQFGSLLSAWICYGMLSWEHDWAWRLPTLLQCVGGAVIAIFIVCGQMPESPRYLVSKGRIDEAANTLARMHANGDTSDALVVYELAEIKEGLEIDKEYSSFKSIFQTKGNRKRLAALIFIAVSGQMNGNALVSYYLPQILKLVGITDVRKISGINGGLAIFSTVNSAISAQFVERAGRRPLWRTATIGVTLCFVVMTALSANFAKGAGNSAQSYVFVAGVYLFFMFYNMGWIVLGALYTTEILPYGIRSKALSLYVFIQTAAICFNQYVNPIGLDRIGWKYYLVFIVLDCCWVAICWFLMVETRRLSLEEVSRLFDGKEASDRVANHALETPAMREKEAEFMDSDKGAVSHLDRA